MLFSSRSRLNSAWIHSKEHYVHKITGLTELIRRTTGCVMTITTHYNKRDNDIPREEYWNTY